MKRPIISVLVPIFNVEKYLRQSLESICAQTVRDLEIILIDDGSTDESGAIVDEFANSDSRIIAIHKTNSGYGDSLNQGLTLSRGEWISIIEPDDWADTHMYELLLKYVASCQNKKTQIDIVKGGYWRFITDQNAQTHEEPCVHLNLIGERNEPFSIDEDPQMLALHPCIWSALYKKSFLDEFGIRFLPIPGAGWADNPFFVETTIAARAILWLNKPVYHYREFEDGKLSHLNNWRTITDRWNEMNMVLRKYDAESPSILAAHACRGCSYLQMLFHDFNQDDPDLVEAEQAMADSLDFNIVKRSPFIPSEYKRAYARFLPFTKRLKLIL